MRTNITSRTDFSERLARWSFKMNFSSENRRSTDTCVTGKDNTAIATSFSTGITGRSHQDLELFSAHFALLTFHLLANYPSNQLLLINGINFRKFSLKQRLRLKAHKALVIRGCNKYAVERSRKP